MPLSSIAHEVDIIDAVSTFVLPVVHSDDDIHFEGPHIAVERSLPSCEGDQDVDHEFYFHLNHPSPMEVGIAYLSLYVQQAFKQWWLMAKQS